MSVMTTTGVKAITREEWKALTHKQRWDVVSALRGPDLFKDIHSDAIKYLSTAVIRHAVREVFPVNSAVVNRKNTICVVPSHHAWAHFASHIVDAAKVLDIPYVIGEFTGPHAVVLSKAPIVDSCTLNLPKHYGITWTKVEWPKTLTPRS